MTDADSKPHLRDDEQALLRGEMLRAKSYLEFGTGGSTVLAAECGIRRIVSVDSDPAWLRRIGERIAHERATLDIELIHCNLGRTGDWGMPLDRDLERVATWPQYFLQPWQRFLSCNETPDLILVDGRFRVACVLYSLLHLHLAHAKFPQRTTRIAVHDFSDRPYYGRILEHAVIVASAGTMVVVEQNRAFSASLLLQDLFGFQFDAR